MSTFNCTERTDGQYTTTVTDSSGNVVPLASVTALTLTLTDVDSGTVINSRDTQDVLNTNDVTYHATSGLLTWAVKAADLIIVDTTKGHELHRAVFVLTYVSGKKVVHEVYLLVRNISGVV